MALTGPKRDTWLVLTNAAAEAWFVGRRQISPIYLADAALEIALAGGVLRGLRSNL